jgi:hypothetical protein
MGVKNRQGRVFLCQMPEYGNQHSVFEYVGMVAGMEGVAITEHG